MNSRYRRERRQPPYYLLTGLIIGAALGLLISLVIFPVKYTNVPPETLSTSGKDTYRLMIASAYQYDQNLNRAQTRLSLLREEDAINALQNQATRSASKIDAQVLLNLMKVLNSSTTVKPSPTVSPTAAPVTFTPTLTETAAAVLTASVTSTSDTQAVRTATPQAEVTQPVNTPRPSATVSSAQSIPFVLSEKRTVCNPALQESLIQIEVFDADGNPLPNAEILVSWADGSSNFYTGYYPEISAGYADFTMQVGTNYLVKIGEIGEIVQNLSAPQCEDDNLPFWGSIYLRFDEP
jgi:hypothetical protein